jgi:ADP-heptose:LPS heptosyltransferase
MKILFAPFAASAPNLEGKPSPKNYPWPKELAGELEKSHEVIQVGGNGDEQVAKDFRRNLSFAQVGELIKSSDTGICVDSFLQHAFWYFGRRAIVVFSISDPVIFGHPENLNLLKDRKYLRPNQFDLYYINQYNNDAFVSPKQVIESLNGLRPD